MPDNNSQYRILIYGECDHYGSGAWCYYSTLKDMGHEVDYCSQFRHLEKYSMSLPFKIYRKITGGKVLPSDRKRHITHLIEHVKSFKPNIVIVLKGLLIDGKTVKTIREMGAWVAMINHDDFFSAYKTSRSAIQFKAIPEYDYIFCTKEVNVAEVKNLNNNAGMLLFAYYPAIHRPPVINDSDKKLWFSDIVFIGNCYPERIRQMEYLVTQINRKCEIKIYGPNWEAVSVTSPLKKFIQNRYLNPEEMSKAIYYSNISLGFLCKEHRDDYTQRTFEIPATRGVLLAERTKRHITLLEENKDAVFFDSNNYDELVNKVTTLLNDNDFRNCIRSNGYQRITSDRHAYIDRMEQLIDQYTQQINY